MTIRSCLSSALPDGVALLQRFAEQGTEPHAARAQLRSLQKEFPKLRLDLLWETTPDPVGQDQTHYDLLLQLPGQATATLSYCPSRDIPWALQGASRWADKDLLRVNTTTIGVDRALAAIDFIWEDRQLMTHVVNYAIVMDQLKQRQLDVSEAELSAAVESDHAANRAAGHTGNDLPSAVGLNRDDWRQVIADRWRVAKLRDQVVTDEQVEQYYAAHANDWQQLTLIIVPFVDRAEAEAAKHQVQCGNTSLGQLAERRAAGDSAATSGIRASIVTCLREDLPPSLLNSLNSLNALEAERVLGPLAEGDQFLLLKVLACHAPELNATLRERIAGRLFHVWLDQQRQAARIEWFWGPA